MTKENRPHEEGGTRSGGPAGSVTASTDNRYTPHDCIESAIVWGLLAGSIPAPNTPAFRALYALAEALSQRSLAAIRPILAHSGMWAAIPNRYDDMERLRDTYATPPQSPRQIAAKVAHSWKQFDRGLGPIVERAASIRAVIYA